MKTSWGKVANWYDELLEKQDGTYQKEVILPNLLRILSRAPTTTSKASETILDIACGQGFFSREIAKAGAVKVIACDIAKELIAIAHKNPDPISKKIEYHVSSADKLDFCPSESVTTAIIVLALQNIEHISDVFRECARVLKSQSSRSSQSRDALPKGLSADFSGDISAGLSSGRLIVVLNHPAFRIPKHSSWQWDEEGRSQYRRIDAYMSDSRERIDMNPGNSGKKFTVSFHRPLQVYFKALTKAGFVVTRLEEWVSHKQSSAGPRAKEEDRIRKEIPMFLMIEARKI